MSTLTFFNGFSKPADGDTSWGGELRNMMDQLDRLLSPNDRTYFVAEGFTQANLYPNGLPSSRRYFDTVQGALDAVNAASDDQHTTIVLWPGIYTENITIEKSVHLVGLSGGHAVRGMQTRIKGDGNATPVTIDPANGSSISVSINDIFVQIENLDHGGSTRSYPHWLWMKDQGSGNYGSAQNVICLNNVAMRTDDLNAGDLFTYGILIEGKSTLVTLDTQIRVPGPGDINADMTYPVMIRGNTTTGVEAQLQMKQTDIVHWGTAGSTITMQNNAAGMVTRCGFTRARADVVTFGGSGSNSCTGLNTDNEFEALNNSAGYSTLVGA